MRAGNRICRPFPTLRAGLLYGAQFLLEAGVDSHRLDAEILLRCALKMEPWELYARFNDLLGGMQIDEYQRLLMRRAAREPIAYITGHKEFWSLDFVVTPDVLIPRPESELIVEVALRHLRSKQQSRRAMDLGTGSGVLAICLARECPGMTFSAVDLSSNALAIAQLNSARLGLAGTIEFLKGDLFGPISRNDFDVIVANPPYIPTQELETLAPEIREWEPVIALDGGIDGLDVYRRIIGQAHLFLVGGGKLVLEIGANMATAVSELIEATDCYSSMIVDRDYAGHERVVSAIRF